MRVLGAVVAAVLVAQLVLLAPVARGEVGPTEPTRVRTGVRAGLAVLHQWDERRARAWAEIDEQALRSLYLSGSAAARSDVRLLRSYTKQGLVVRRMVTQVFGVTILRQERNHLVLRVRDRVAGGVVDAGDHEVALPSTRPVVRRLELRRVDGHWRLVTVPG